MIKIEFNKTSIGFDGVCSKFDYSDNSKYLKIIFGGFSLIKSITEYIPTQDPMLDRSEILKQLGISQQEDEQNQIKWSKL